MLRYYYTLFITTCMNFIFSKDLISQNKFCIDFTALHFILYTVSEKSASL